MRYDMVGLADWATGAFNLFLERADRAIEALERIADALEADDA